MYKLAFYVIILRFYYRIDRTYIIDYKIPGLFSRECFLVFRPFLFYLIRPFPEAILSIEGYKFILILTNLIDHRTQNFNSEEKSVNRTIASNCTIFEKDSRWFIERFAIA